ncbi:MAG: MFS transporter [Coxiellaceae bacterium]|nr:MFS transporter [Coxiellaceae bacterium]
MNEKIEKSDNSKIWHLAPLFLVILIDGMGLGLLFPVLNALIIDPQSGFVVHHTTEWRSVVYGITIGIFMLSWFFGASILGDLSDMVGRKKSLMICLLGAFAGYLLSAIAIPLGSLSLLILGRIIAGFTAGSQPIAQAAIVDVSTEEHKARNISLILLAVSVGFVIGPIFGGLLTAKNLVSWFNFSTPLYFAGLISLANAVILWFSFDETFHREGKVRIKLHHAIQVFISAFQHKRIRYLSFVLLVFILGWSNYFSFISMFMFDRYAYNETWTSWFLADMALGFAVGCYLVDAATRLLGLKWTVSVGLILAAGCMAVITWTHDITLSWIMNFFVGVTVANAYSTLLTIFSNRVSSDEQGWVMGVTGSIMALAFAIVSFVVGPFTRDIVSLPMILAVAGMALAGLLLLPYCEKE